MNRIWKTSTGILLKHNNEVQAKSSFYFKNRLITEHIFNQNFHNVLHQTHLNSILNTEFKIFLCYI